MARIVVDELVSVIKPELDKGAARAAVGGLRNVGNAAERAGKKASGLRSKLSNLARRGLRMAASGAAALGTAAIAAATAITKATNDFAKANDELVKTADNLGIASDAYQELRFAADRSGISSKVFDKGLRTLNKNLGDLAARGTGPASVALRQLGLEFDDIAGKSPEVQLEIIADAMRNVDDVGTRTSATMTLLGGSGNDFQKLLEGGAEGVQRLREEAQLYGAVIDEDILRQSEQAVDAQANLDAAFKGLSNTLLSRFVPSMAESKQQVADFIVENREIIGLGMDRAMTVLGDAISVVKEAFSQATAVLQPFLEGFFSATDIFSVMVDGTFQVIDAIVSLGTAFTDLFGITDETVTFIGEIVGSVIGETVQTIFDYFSDTILRVAEFIGDLGDSFDMFAEGDFLDGIKNIGQSLVDFLLEPIRFIVRELIDLADVIDSDLVPTALRNFAQGGGVAIARKDNAAARKASDNKKEEIRLAKERQRENERQERENIRKEREREQAEARAPSTREAAAIRAAEKAKRAGDAEFQKQLGRGVSEAKALELAQRAEARAKGGRRGGGGGGSKDAFSELVQGKIDEQVKAAELAAGAGGLNARKAGKSLRIELEGLAKQGDFSRFGIDATALAGGAAQAGVGPASTTPVSVTIFQIQAGAIQGGININAERFGNSDMAAARQLLVPVAREIQLASEIVRTGRVQ